MSGETPGGGFERPDAGNESQGSQQSGQSGQNGGATGPGGFGGNGAGVNGGASQPQTGTAGSVDLSSLNQRSKTPAGIIAGPMTLSDMMDGAVKLLRLVWKPLILLLLIQVIPAALFQSASIMLQGGSAAKSPTMEIGGGSVETFNATNDIFNAGGLAALGLIGLAIILFFAYIVITPVMSAAVMRLFSGAYFGEKLKAGKAVRYGFSRYWTFLGVMVLLGLAFIGITFLLGLPFALVIFLAVQSSPWWLVLIAPLVLIAIAVYAYFATMVAFVYCAIVVEDVGAVQGISRSWALVKKRFWAVFGILLLAEIVSSIVGGILGGVVQFPVFIMSAISGGVHSFAVSAILAIVSIPFVIVGSAVGALVGTGFMVAITLLLYIDSRVRFEGFDINNRLVEDQNPSPISKH